MAERSARKLERLLRVRTLQLGQVQAQETRARDRVEQEQALRARIAGLAANVAPVVRADFAATMGAAAHYRERLQQSAQAAEARVSAAEQGLDTAQHATREARRDQSAIEKLMARADAAEALKHLRELEKLPPAPPRNRHDPC